MTVRQIAAAGVLAGGIGWCAWAAEPAPDPEPGVFEGILTQVREWAEDREAPPSEEEYIAYIATLTDPLDLSGMTAAELEEGAFLMLATDAGRRKMDARLAELSEKTGAEGAEAAILRMLVAMREDHGETAARIEGALTHPGLPDALKAGRGYALLGVMEYMPEAVLRDQAEPILGLVDYVSASAPVDALAALNGYVSAVNTLGDRVGSDQRKQILDTVAGVLSEARDQARQRGEDEAVAFLGQQIDYLEGAAARGELIDTAAPAIHFDWISDGGTESALADFKGKVVVIDFWATWCGPCVASFPKLRELRERYPEDQVEILGVTSLQGAHYVRGSPPVDTSEDPAEEYRLMSEYVNDMDMTWTVAFSKENVFNPEYGVEGIPHLAILDREGRVRYNGLNPHGDLNDKTEKIDKLLAESGDS